MVRVEQGSIQIWCQELHRSQQRVVGDHDRQDVTQLGGKAVKLHFLEVNHSETIQKSGCFEYRVDQNMLPDVPSKMYLFAM